MIFDKKYTEKNFFEKPKKVPEEIEDGRNDILDSIFSNTHSPSPSTSTGIFTPIYSRKPDSFYSPHRLVNAHLCAPQRLINLSFSQPSTPKTPAFTGPCQLTSICNRPGYESMILTTPMLIETLDKLQQQTEDSQAPYPDILQLIDDDTCSGTEFGEHTECNQTNLSDSNIVDYLLYLSQDLKHQSPHIQTSVTRPQPKEHVHRISPRRNFHRPRRRTKLMTEEERRSLERIRGKQKQRKKERFNKTLTSGSRKSKRVRKQVVRYSC